MKMLEKTQKLVITKGKATRIVREQYLRDDIPCRSPMCKLCPQSISKEILLHKDANHYAIPCYDIISKYLEVLELPELTGIIILQSIASKVLQTSRRHYERILNISRDIRRHSIIFLNEICRGSNVIRKSSDSFETWLIKSSVNAAEFYANHLESVFPIILITENAEDYKSHIKHPLVKVCSFKEYLESMWKNIPSALLLYESINMALSTASVKDSSKLYNNYLPQESLETGLKVRQYFKGYLHVNKHNTAEAYVRSTNLFSKDDGDIFICGLRDRNRAIHGDEVVVQMLPKNEWKSRSLSLVENATNPQGETTEEASDGAMPSGKVVGIIERRWRSYVATLPEEDEMGHGGSRMTAERILVIPYDYRIPKIRIATKQAASLKNQRILVRIDAWDMDSQYPNGHFVRSLGEIDVLETEVQALLMEHNIFVQDFPPSLASELPSVPWKVDEAEKRRDLRDSHLVFSIDPKGCEDVDDTMSIRNLPNGLLELGVHIADVTHFVPAFSLVDIEAQSRATSVYLPDRRYDMLPAILSGDLCSLLADTDRYAVSICWDMDTNYQIQSVWFGRTILRSRYKLCYEDAQAILRGRSAQEMVHNIPELQGLKGAELKKRFRQLKEALTKLTDIARVLRRKRLDNGGLELDSLNVKFEIDRELPSIIKGIKKTEQLEVHRTVAEFMILANHWVAKKIAEAFPHLAVLRHHPSPKMGNLAELQKLAQSKGFAFHFNSNKELATSLAKAEDPKDPLINQILRILTTYTMNQSTYFCIDNVPLADYYHYGLGLDFYTHFTSPIRRYADVLVHRLLLAAVENGTCTYKAAEMQKICDDMNFKHRAAQDIEYAAQELFQARYFEELLSKNVSSLVDGVIYAIRKNGMLVLVPAYGIKGAVCVCNRDKKVSVKGEFVEGTVEAHDFSLSVTAGSYKHTYNIFDHVTLSIKILKSRAHRTKIVFDLVKDKPYLSKVTAKPKSTDPSDIEEEKICDFTENETPETDSHPFSLYEYLERLRQLTIQAK